MTWSIDLKNLNFPPNIKKSMPLAITVNEAELFWAAITVGRPCLQDVLAHGQYSLYEILGRWGMIRANLTLEPTSSSLHNSEAFKALDPTEKAWVNFSLGMVFTKIFAEKVLGMPWLMHFKWFAGAHSVKVRRGKSTPDFIGLDPATGEYHVLEAKGRNSGFAQTVLDGAKEQANRVVNIDNKACKLHIGALLYRKKRQRLAFAWADPVPDEQTPIELQETRETWRDYYRVVWGLYLLGSPEREWLAEMTGWYVDLDPVAAKIIGEFMSGNTRDWKGLRKRLMNWAANPERAQRETMPQSGRDWITFRDGIRLRPAGLEPTTTTVVE